ncbi:ABC transporter ATP-binding protein [Agrobacterium rubi]|nr:ABC transporter ATP-binding protein [Agrobacterium rubi]NTF22886.1 ABC transporter ATP-binding protein [Agrobacterium rubi]NTF29817.1 ABC transporter ATP-binding protein [Agrobacterium rubi]
MIWMSAASVQQTDATAHAKADSVLLRLLDVNLAFRETTVLKDIRMEMRAGEFISVIGPSGCGKTSLLRVLAGLYSPTDGKAIYANRELKGPQADIAVVFQDYAKALLPWRTAYGNVSLSLEAMKVPKAERPDIIHDLLAKTGLAAHADKFPNQMSGGMQQRLQIARCLAQKPKLLLMDEPFGALDAMTRQGLQDELLSILAASGAAAFFVTHDLEEAIYLSDRVVGLLPHPGRVSEVFDVNIQRPRHQLETRETAEFIHLRRELNRFIAAAEGAH